MLEIAGGIILAVLVLRFWPLVLLASIALFVLGAILFAGVWAYATWGWSAFSSLLLGAGTIWALSRLQRLSGVIRARSQT